jgi:hypothetical protein
VYEAFQQCPLLAERVKLAEELNRYVPAERLMIDAPEYKGIKLTQHLPNDESEETAE